MKIIIAMLLIIDIVAAVAAALSIKALCEVLDKNDKPLDFGDLPEDEEDELTRKYTKSIEGIMNYDPYGR